MKKLHKTIFPILLLFCVSCATTPEQRYLRGVDRANKTPFWDKPALYEKLLRTGDINKEQYNVWIEGWRKEQANIEKQQKQEAKRRADELAKQKREWESLTPYQRKQILMEQERLAMEQQMFYQEQENADALQRQARQAAVLDALQRSAEIK
jgi:hypothetical protein